MPRKQVVISISISLIQPEISELTRFIDCTEDQDYMIRVVEGWLDKVYHMGLEDGAQETRDNQDEQVDKNIKADRDRVKEES